MSEFPKLENESDSSTDSEKTIGVSRSSSEDFRTASEGPSLLEIVELLLSPDDNNLLSNLDVFRSNGQSTFTPVAPSKLLPDNSAADDHLNALADSVIYPRDDSTKDVIKIGQNEVSLETADDNDKTKSNEFTENVFFRNLSFKLSELSSRLSHEDNEAVINPFNETTVKGDKTNAFDTHLIKKQKRKLSNLLILAIVQNINEAFSEEGLENIKKHLREKIVEFQKKQVALQSSQSPAGHSGQAQPEACQILPEKLLSLQDKCEIERHHLPLLLSDNHQQPTISTSAIQQLETSTTLPKHLLAWQQQLVTSSARPVNEPGKAHDYLATSSLLPKRPTTLAALQQQLIASAAIQLQLASSPLLQQLEQSATPGEQETAYTFLQEQITAFLTAQPSSSLFDSTSQELLGQSASVYLTPTSASDGETNVLPNTQNDNIELLTNDKYSNPIIADNALEVNQLRREIIRNEGLVSYINKIDTAKQICEGEEIDRRSIKALYPISDIEESTTLDKCIAGEHVIKNDGDVFDTPVRECLIHKKSLYTQSSIPSDVCSITKQVTHKTVENKVIDTGLGDRSVAKEWTKGEDCILHSITDQKVVNRSAHCEIKEGKYRKQTLTQEVQSGKDLSAQISSTSKGKSLSVIVLNDLELEQRSIEKLSPESQELLTTIANCIVQQVINKSIVNGQIDTDLFSKELLNGRNSIASISDNIVDDLIRKSIVGEIIGTEFRGKELFSGQSSLESIANSIIVDVLNMSLVNKELHSGKIDNTKQLADIQESTTTVLCNVSDKVIKKISDAEVIESRKNSASNPDSITFDHCTVQEKVLANTTKVIETNHFNKKKKYVDSAGQQPGCDLSCSLEQCQVLGNEMNGARVQTKTMDTSLGCELASDATGGDGVCPTMPKHACLPEVFTKTCNCSRVNDACLIASCTIPVSRCHHVCTVPPPTLCVCDVVQQRYCCHPVCTQLPPFSQDRPRYQISSPRPEEKVTATQQTYSQTSEDDPTLSGQLALDPLGEPVHLNATNISVISNQVVDIPATQQNRAASLTVDISASQLNQIEQSQTITPLQQNMTTSLTFDFPASQLNQVEQSQTISPLQQNMTTSLTFDFPASQLNQVEQSQTISPLQQNIVTNLTFDIAASQLNQIEQSQNISSLQQNISTSEVVHITESQQNQSEQKLQENMATKAVDTVLSQLNQDKQIREISQSQQNITPGKAINILASQQVQVGKNEKISPLQEDVVSTKAGYLTASEQILVEQNLKKTSTELNVPIENGKNEQINSRHLSKQNNETAIMSRVLAEGDNSDNSVRLDQDESLPPLQQDSSITSACSLKKENKDSEQDKISVDYYAYNKESSGSVISNEGKISLPLIRLPRNIDINEAALEKVKKFSLKARGLTFEEILKLSLGSLFDEKDLENYIRELNNNENDEDGNQKYGDEDEKDEDISKFTLNNSGNEMTESPENEDDRQMSVAEMKEMFEKSKLNPLQGRQSVNEDFKMEAKTNEHNTKAEEPNKNTIFINNESTPLVSPPYPQAVVVNNESTPLVSPPYRQVVVENKAGQSVSHTLKIQETNNPEDGPNSGLLVIPQRKSVSFSLTPDKPLLPEYTGGVKADDITISPEDETIFSNQEGHRQYINSPHPSATVLHYLKGKEQHQKHEATFEQSSALRKSLEDKKLLSNTKPDPHSFTGSSDMCEEMEKFCRCCQEKKKARNAALCSQQQRKNSDEEMCLKKKKACCPCQFQHDHCRNVAPGCSVHDPCRNVAPGCSVQRHCKMVSSCDDLSSEREGSSQSTESEKCFRAKLDPNFTSIRICFKPNFKCRVCSDDCSCRDVTSNDCLDTSTSLVSEICIETSFTQDETSSSEDSKRGNRRGQCPIECDSLEKEASEEENTGESGV